jgi:hypothetical protein
MLNKIMIVQKFFNKKVEKEYFFIQGKIDINADYFINKIKSCWGTEQEKKYFTNVKGRMTSWDYFNEDKEFHKALSQLIYYIDSQIKLFPYKLAESWGLELRKNQYTAFHTHSGRYWSGVIYLNSSQQELSFPEIKQKIKPEPGVFGIFSSFLEHGCDFNEEDISKYAISFNMDEDRPW